MEYAIAIVALAVVAGLAYWAWEHYSSQNNSPDGPDVDGGFPPANV